MRRGVRLGVDVGSVRIGVARSDIDGILAVPVATVKRGPGDTAELAAMVEEWSVVEVLVGLPVGLDGKEGAAAAACREFAHQLAGSIGGVPIRLIDERLTTTSAHRAMADAGRNSRGRRSVVDQAAAVIIVQNALDTERTSGRVPGVPL